MNTTQLECFLSVSNFLNFSRAAEQLGLTQPAVSHQINTLEDELGVKLFYRTSKRVRLTQQGYLFSQYAQEILSLTRASRARLKESQESSATRFGIGCRSFLELRLLYSVLPRLRAEIPNLYPILRLVPHHSLEHQLEDGDVQIIFTFQESAPKRALYRELTQRSVVCICHKDHPLAAHDQLTLAQLREGGPFAAYPPNAAPPSLLSIQSQLITGRGSDQLYFCDGLETLYTLVETGFAFAVVAALPQIPMPDLRMVPIQGLPALSFGAAYYAGAASPVLRNLFRHMQELFSQTGA